jgi:hypothetical protein
VLGAAVPVVTVDEDGDSSAGKDEVGRAGGCEAAVQPEAGALGVEAFAEQHFGDGVGPASPTEVGSGCGRHPLLCHGSKYLCAALAMLGGPGFYPGVMIREYGREFPERPLMAVVSDLLGIEHFTTSRGSSVRRDFLEAVAVALQVPAATARGMATKDDLLSLVVQTATDAPMDPDLVSVGGTVTNNALQVIVDGITRRGVPGRPEVPATESTQVVDEDEAELDLSELSDERDRRLMETAVREGRDRFRSAVLDAYGGCCAVTGFDAAEALQAAHIYPYQGPATNRVSNGILLRADIHSLFDRGALAFSETSYEVLVKPHLLVTRYADLADGTTLRLPRLRAHRPSTAALRSHREWAGL